MKCEAAIYQVDGRILRHEHSLEVDMHRLALQGCTPSPWVSMDKIAILPPDPPSDTRYEGYAATELCSSRVMSITTRGLDPIPGPGPCAVVPPKRLAAGGRAISPSRRASK